jgi:uncharacterized Zn-binding protein involved in type VI secretion
LIKGDKATNGAVIIGGSTMSSYEGMPTAREGDPVYCPVCKRNGAIVCVGPRWPSTDDGKEEALSGDICSCDCRPPPVFHASRPYVMTMTREDSARYQAGETSDFFAVTFAPSARDIYDELLIATVQGRPVADYPFLVETSDGQVVSGYTDNLGRLPRIATASAGSLTVYWGDDALARQNGA